jgi:hypothetical protein
MDETSLAKYFSLVDGDGNGLIDPEEFLSMLGKLGLKREKSVVHKAFTQLDADGNGLIDLAEFTRWWHAQGPAATDSGSRQTSVGQLKNRFDAIDHEGLGRIDMGGFRDILASLGMHPSSADLRLTFSQTPRQDSRYFTFEEFLNWWLEQAKD